MNEDMRLMCHILVTARAGFTLPPSMLGGSVRLNLLRAWLLLDARPIVRWPFRVDDRLSAPRFPLLAPRNAESRLGFPRAAFQDVM
jgi:hypothetical protein